MTGDFKHIPELCKEQDFTEDTLKNESYELFLRGRTVQRYSSELDTRRRSGRSGVLTKTSKSPCLLSPSLPTYTVTLLCNRSCVNVNSSKCNSHVCHINCRLPEGDIFWCYKGIASFNTAGFFNVSALVPVVWINISLNFLLSLPSVSVSDISLFSL